MHPPSPKAQTTSADALAALALESIADGVVLLDHDGVVLLWNRGAERITGIEGADAVGRHAKSVIPGYAPSVASEPSSRPETRLVKVGGRELWLSFAGVPIEEGTVYTFRDLTEEHALEHLRSDLVSTVSHELRTPLAAIYGAAVTVRRSDVVAGGETQDLLLEIIETESNRLGKIVNDLLITSHLDSGQLKLHLEAVDATAVTKSVVDAARAHLPQGIALEFEPERRLPPVVADEQQLRQVLVNLVENAVKYSPDGGPVRVGLEREAQHVLWKVSDRGLGIPASERGRVFEKFYRLDPNMTRGIGGTGLGLYICHELVERLHGHLWIEPGRRKGSTFCLQMPIARAPKRVKHAV